MTMLISIAQANEYVRRDTSDDDMTLTLLIQAASGAVINYLASGPSVSYLDSDGNGVTVDSDGVTLDVPAVVQAATLYMTGWLYRHRDDDPDKAFQPGFLPAPVTALLYPLRDPVFA